MKLRIFLVEDNDDARLLLTLMFEAAGHEVRSAQTMGEALRDFSKWNADVLLSDIGLPDGNGADLLHGLRSRGHAPYAIAMSGYGASGDVAASLSAGFRHHVIKPLDLTELDRLFALAGAELESSR